MATTPKAPAEPGTPNPTDPTAPGVTTPAAPDQLTRYGYAHNTFDLPRLASEPDRPRSSEAGSAVLLTESEFQAFQHAGLVSSLKAAEIALDIEPVALTHGGKPERFLVSRGGGWYDVARPDGTLVNTEPVRGRTAALAVSL